MYSYPFTRSLVVPVHDEVLSSVSFLFCPFTSVQAPPSQSSPTTHSLLDRIFITSMCWWINMPSAWNALFFTVCLENTYQAIYLTSLTIFSVSFPHSTITDVLTCFRINFQFSPSISLWAPLSVLYSWFTSFSFEPPIAAWCWAFNKHSTNVGSVLNHPAELHNGPQDSLSLMCMWIRWDSHSLD